MTGTLTAGGYVLEDPKKIILNRLNDFFEELQTSKNATPWFDIIRQCRHPAFLWEIDFIEPKEPMNIVNEYIRKSEQILYGSNANVYINPEYTADKYQEVCFHTIRAYLRAEEYNFDASLKILNQIIEWSEDLSLVRRSNLIMHLFKACLCTKDFEMSYKYFKDHWYLTKYSSEAERFNEGIWDNMMIMYMIMCFFIEYTDEYQLFLSTHGDIELENLHKHKKISIMYLLKNDHSWIVSQLSLPFYNHARELMPTLPEYFIQKNTPRNKETIIPARKNALIKAYPGWQGTYFEKLCEEIATDGARPEQIDNYLYSFLHFCKNYENDHQNEDALFEFLRAKQLAENNIVYAGCGLAHIYSRFDGETTCVDVAEQMVYECEKQDIKVNLMSIEKFMANTDISFDLFFSSGLLEHLSEYSIDMLLSACRRKTKNVCLFVEIREEHVDIPIIGNIFLHRTNKPADWWKKKFNQSFDCEYEDCHEGLFVYGKSR